MTGYCLMWGCSVNRTTTGPIRRDYAKPPKKRSNCLRRSLCSLIMFINLLINPRTGEVGMSRMQRLGWQAQQRASAVRRCLGSFSRGSSLSSSHIRRPRFEPLEDRLMLANDTIGFYQPDISLFHLKDTFTPGASDQFFQFGPGGNAGWPPLTGD